MGLMDRRPHVPWESGTMGKWDQWDSMVVATVANHHWRHQEQEQRQYNSHKNIKMNDI